MPAKKRSAGVFRLKGGLFSRMMKDDRYSMGLAA